MIFLIKNSQARIKRILVEISERYVRRCKRLVDKIII